MAWDVDRHWIVVQRIADGSCAVSGSHGRAQAPVANDRAARHRLHRATSSGSMRWISRITSGGMEWLMNVLGSRWRMLSADAGATESREEMPAPAGAREMDGHAVSCDALPLERLCLNRV